jgi:type II secretory pathway component PulM
VGTLATLLGALLGLAGVVSAVVYYVKKGLSNSVDLRQTDAALKQEQARVAALEAAAAEVRAQRRQDIDVATDHATSATDAARVLRDLTGADDPAVN